MPSVTVTAERQSDMASEMKQQPCEEAVNKPDVTPASRPRFIMEYGGPVMDFRLAHKDVMDRLDAIRAVGDEDQARELEEEAEVLWWKMCRAIKPDREIPVAILEAGGRGQFTRRMRDRGRSRRL